MLRVAAHISPWIWEHICSNKICIGTPSVLTYLSWFASVLPHRIVHAFTTNFLFFSSQLKIVPVILRCLRHSQINKINKHPCTTYECMSADINISCLKFVKYIRAYKMQAVLSSCSRPTENFINNKPTCTTYCCVFYSVFFLLRKTRSLFLSLAIQEFVISAKKNILINILT